MLMHHKGISHRTSQIERIVCSRVLVRLVLAFQLRGFPIDLCMAVPW
jgi:hypothetical protein